jgi:hypothetical protein
MPYDIQRHDVDWKAVLRNDYPSCEIVNQTSPRYGVLLSLKRLHLIEDCPHARALVGLSGFD